VSEEGRAEERVKVKVKSGRKGEGMSREMLRGGERGGEIKMTL
jgi:hypothetical protein